MIGLKFSDSARFGDKFIFCTLPENYYLATGQKLVDVEKSWFLDYNPFVLRNETPSKIIYPWVHQRRSVRGMISQDICKQWSIPCRVVYPRLYHFEEERTLYKSLVLCTTGYTNGAIPFEIIRFIRERYQDYFIFQLGGKSDVDAGVFDRRGIPIWDAVKYMAQAEAFIGPDSFLMHVAAAYPKVRKKILLLNRTEDEVQKFLPLGLEPNAPYGWVYPCCEVFNCFKKDIGLTRSYLSI